MSKFMENTDWVETSVIWPLYFFMIFWIFNKTVSHKSKKSKCLILFSKINEGKVLDFDLKNTCKSLVFKDIEKMKIGNQNTSLYLIFSFWNIFYIRASVKMFLRCQIYTYCQ